MKRIFAIAIVIAVCAAVAMAEENRSDSTLRIDYVIGGDAEHPAVMFDGASKSAGWWGRRDLRRDPVVAGNGSVTLIDASTGDTIYRSTFSTLMQEWLSTDEAREMSRGFEHVVLVPLPAGDAFVDMELRDSRRRPIARHRYRYRRSDELVAVKRLPACSRRTLLAPKDSLRAINVAVLAEGYTRSQIDSFYRHAERAMNEILSYEPFKNHRDMFRFTAVATVSADSGVSVPRRGEWRDTAFGAHFSTFHSDRYLTTPRVKALHDALTGVPYEHIIVLANTDEYGGGGIYGSYLLTSARNSEFRPVVVHEFGHSFAGLADEYFYDGDVMEDSYPTDVEPWEPNITTLVDFGGKWMDMVGREPLIGIYEGGGYSSKGVYRPADVCRMRDNHTVDFCAVCRRAIERMIESY